MLNNNLAKNKSSLAKKYMWFCLHHSKQIGYNGRRKWYMIPMKVIIKASRHKHHLSGSFIRTVTNTELPFSTYRAIVTAPKGVNISVNPNVFSYVPTVDGKMKKSIGSASFVLGWWQVSSEEPHYCIWWTSREKCIKVFCSIKV